MGKTAKNPALIILLIVWLIFGWQFFFKGLVPAPLDFLTNFYAPWQSYQAFPIKNPAIPDVVSQIIPWKIFSIDQLKSGHLPFWNPYNFSGTPHLANFQSAVFNPFNFIFFIPPFITAWSLFVLLQNLICSVFTYLYCRKINLSWQASIISAIGFGYGGFITAWLEYATLGYAILWLPMTLYLLESYFISGKIYWIFLFALSISFSILSGHMQISLYLILGAFLYILFNVLANKISCKLFIFSLLGIISSFLLTAFQILPTIQYYFNSIRSNTVPLDWYHGGQVPWEQLITFIFPDFFGHPAARNQWAGGSYVEMMGYIGIIPLFLTMIFFTFQNIKPLIYFKKSGFFVFLLIFSLLFCLPTVFSEIIIWLKLPVLSSSAPGRIICLVSFSLAILSGFGWDLLVKKIFKKNSKLNTIIIVGFTFVLIFLPASLLINKIAFRNIIFLSSVLILFLTLILLIFNRKIKIIRLNYWLYFFVLLLILTDLFRFNNKFLPYSNKKDFFPSLPIINYFQQNAGVNRIYGILDDNLNLPFRMYKSNGYDSLNIKEYQELIKSSKDGSANLDDRVTGETISKDGRYSKKIMDILGIKYLISGKSDLFALKSWEYPNSFINTWEDKAYVVYENLDAWPRFLLTRNYKLADKNNFLPSTIDISGQKPILIDYPGFEPEDKQGSINIISYNPDKIELKANWDYDGILFVSDSYYPGWQALIDNRPVNISRANYALKAIQIPAGMHNIDLIYKEKYFFTGLKISLLSLAAILFLIIGQTFFYRKYDK